jgi:hypothetical protein
MNLRMKSSRSKKKQQKNCKRCKQTFSSKYKSQLKFQYLNPNLLVLCYYLVSSSNSWQTPSVRLRSNTKNSCLNSLEIRDLLLYSCTADQCMGGELKISTLDVTTRERQYPCSKSKTETASAATPRLSGSLLILLSMLAIVTRCYSICLSKAASQTKGQPSR